MYDTVGQLGTASSALSLLSKNGGRFVTIAGSLAPSSQVPAGTTQASFINSDTTTTSAQLLGALTEIARAGLLKMPQLSIFDLDQTGAAFGASNSGQVVGKVVITISNSTELY